MTDTKLMAWATTDGNTIGADAGISVMERDVVADDHGSITGQGGETEIAREDAPLGTDYYGELDADAADAMLEGLGFSRVNPWMESGGQWGAEVEKL